MRGAPAGVLLLASVAVPLLTGCTQTPAPNTSAGEPSACAVVQAFIDDRLALAKAAQPSATIAVDDRSDGAGYNAPETDEDAKRGWIGGNGEPTTMVPARALLARLATQGTPGALTRCPSIVRRLDDAHILHGHERIEEMVRTSKGRPYPAALVTVSLPALSDDGTEAVMTVSSTVGPLAGSGSLEYYRRDAQGRWRFVASRWRWVS